MAFDQWPTNKWPVGVSHNVCDYNKALFEILDESARDYPDNVFTIFNGATKTFSQEKDTSDRIANFLVSKGIKKGDRVAIFLPNTPHYPAIFFGILKAGAVCVTCNPLNTSIELNYQLKDSGAKAVFCMDHDQFYPTAAEAVKGTDVTNTIICNVKSYLPKWKAILGSFLNKIPKADQHEPNHLFFDQIIECYLPHAPDINITPDEDLALIIYTGGTTGIPKGAALTHANLTYNLRALEEWIRLPHSPDTPPETIRRGGFHTFLGVLPWYHSFGITTCMMMACGSGSRLVCLPDPQAGGQPFTDVLKAIEKYKATIMPAVPTIFIALTNHPDLNKFNITSLIGCFSGGAPLPPETCKEFEAKSGAVIFEGYGLSETAPVASANPTDKAGRHIGSIGFPIPGTDIKILDLETGSNELPQGEDGEIAISGPQVMEGYWNKPEENKAVFRHINNNRYFLTGDIGHINDEGYIIITDRKKDLILVGGFNVYPRDVEDILFQHPKIAIAAVIGVPDSKSGEAIKAYLQLKPGETATDQEITDFCKQNMAGYKRPKYIEIRKELPVSQTGKVLRRVLRGDDLGIIPQFNL
jgi:long-chain acyl-CoA synthetase